MTIDDYVRENDIGDQKKKKKHKTKTNPPPNLTKGVVTSTKIFKYSSP